jgi:alpha-tubulin suppressor-like RCC1 family protein
VPGIRKHFAADGYLAGTACALRSDGTMACWGMSGAESVATRAPQGVFVQLSVGYDHACAIAADGTVTCWGPSLSMAMAEDPPAGVFVEIAAGETDTCAIRPDGSVVCWGAHPTYQPPADLRAKTP